MLRLCLLGPLALEHDDGRTVRSVLAQPKRFALLAHLAAVHPPASRRRDTLLGLFWPEVDEERARTNLRQALYQLRRSLGPGVITGKGDELVGVDPERLWCDAAAFSEALEKGRPEKALELYRGPFLEGFHLPGAPALERWMDGERRRTRLEASGAAWDLAERAEASGDDATTRRWAERALELTPYDEDALRRFLTVMDRLSQPAAAIRAYERYVRRLTEDLDLEPSAETRTLAERIRQGSGDGRRSTAGPESEGGGTAGGGTGERADLQKEGEAAAGPASRTERTSRVLPRRPDSPAGHGDGVASASEDEKSSWWRRLRRFAHGASTIGGILAVAGAVAVVVFLQGRDSPEGPAAARAEGAENVVVIFPFRVTGGDPHLGEGMVDLLSVKLAGSSRFRPVDPRTAVSAWRRTAVEESPGRKDVLRAAHLVGAGSIVDGSVVRNGSRLVLTASLVDASEGVSVEALSVGGSADSLPGLVDELAARLLAVEAGEGDRLASLTSPSLTAVRSWIRGRAAFREARYREAAAHLGEALARDSTFALAALDLRGVAEWMGGPRRDRQVAERLAWAGRASLTPRDRAMLDVLLGPQYPDPSSLTEDLEADRRAVDLAPDSPEAWFHFGDDLYHFGELVGVEGALEQATDAFARALALDSAFAGPLGHLIELYAYRADTGRVRRLLPLYLARHPDSELADFYRWRGATLLGDTTALVDLRSRSETVPIQSLWRIVGYARFDGRGLEDADTVAEVLRNRPGPPAERAITRTILQGYYLDRGRPEEALAVQRELGGLVPDAELPTPAHPVREELVHGALFWAGDREAAATVVRQMDEGGWELPSDPSARSARMRELCLAAQWWAGEEQSREKVDRAIRTLRGSRYPYSRDPDRARDRRCAALVRVMAADTSDRRETERRVSVLDSLSRIGPSGEFLVRANLASVRALAAIGDLERALSIASRRGPVWHREYFAPRLRWRARLAATLGKEELAERATGVYRTLRGDRLARKQWPMPAMTTRFPAASETGGDARRPD